MLNKNEKQLVKEFATKLIGKRKINETSYAPRLKDKFITAVRDIFEDNEDPSEYPEIYKSLCDALKKEFDYFTKSKADHKF